MESDSTDEGKRRRNCEDDDEEELAKRIKRPGRSPGKGKSRTSDDKLEKILETMQLLTEEVKGMRIEQKKYSDEIRDLKAENESTKKENAKLKEEINTINGRLDAMEREKRRNNIVVQGLTIGDDKTLTPKEALKNFLGKQLEIEVDVKSAMKLGTKTYLVELDNANDKIKVMKNKNKLRTYQEGTIYINDDMTKSEREVQGKIRKVAQEEKKKGKKVKIGYQKVTIDDQEWKWSKGAEKLVKSENKAIKKTEDNAPKND